MTRRHHHLSPNRTLKRIISDSFRAGFEALDDRPTTERRPPANDAAEWPAARGGETEIPTVEAMRA